MPDADCVHEHCSAHWHLRFTSDWLGSHRAATRVSPMPVAHELQSPAQSSASLRLQVLESQVETSSHRV